MTKRSELSILIYVIFVASIVGCAPLVKKAQRKELLRRISRGAGSMSMREIWLKP
jgi:hypothetical protein